MAERQTAPLTYRDLLIIWQDWMDQFPHQPQLDRWLRQYGTQVLRKSAQYRLQINDAMIQATHFRQLADALELSFKDPEFNDWQNWDMLWRQDAAPKAMPQHFWYWIQLRSDSDWQTPLHLSQQKNRRQHFIQLRAQIQQGENSDLFFLWHGLRPTWQTQLRHRASMSEWSAEQHAHFIKSQPHRPPLWLRPSWKKETEEHSRALVALSKSLINDGVEVSIKDHALQAHGGTDITRSQAYQAGEFEIQDMASQMIAAALSPEPGDKIWDACAGAGGKTLALAANMNQKGSITATDLKPKKLDELKRRAKRAGYRNIRTFTWDGQDALRLPAEIRKQGGFDKVLVDAPCSSSGTWRRNPDARWQLSDRRTELHRLQQQLLSHAASSVKPDGVLVYATCSWLVDENEEQVTEFLKRHSSYELVRQELLGSPVQNADTMFVAVMKRSNLSQRS